MTARIHCGFPCAMALVVAALGTAGAHAQEAGQQVYPTADAAATALVSAARSGDETQLLAVLGHRAQDLVSSGDAAEDADDRANFVKRYEQMHRLLTEPDGTVTLYIGAANWPTPVPLVHARRGWYFDTAAGRREILFRRIGRNELSAIRVCEQLVAAEQEYAAGRQGTYAPRIFSTAGTHDGLYWRSADAEEKSPIGPLVARAVASGHASEQGEGPPVPYRGYYFRVLEGQGPHAPGGARSYLVDGRMHGFAFVAYPAEYRSSGVMTFIVSQDGAVYEKDLGRQTAVSGRTLHVFDPDDSWHKVEAGTD